MSKYTVQPASLRSDPSGPNRSKEVSTVRRTAHRHDENAFASEVHTPAHRQPFKRELVGDPLNHYNRPSDGVHADKVGGACSGLA